VDRLKAIFGGGEDAPSSSSRLRLISPLEIHYSQSHIRPNFQDGKPVEDTIAELKSEGCHEELSRLQSGSDAGWESLGAPCGTGGASGSWWLLKPSFPEIEVIQWRIKLRGEDGSVLTDESGCDLYGDREWYTLDNRRLYCLQRAAAALHPEEIRVAVSVVQQEEGNCREFRKFRTSDRGRSVAIGHRDSASPRWSWRKEVGLPDEVLSAGLAVAKPQRRRGPNSGRGQGHRQKDGGYVENQRSSWDFAVNASLFIVVYAMLRIAFHVGRRLLTTPETDAAPLVDQAEILVGGG